MPRHCTTDGNNSTVKCIMAYSFTDLMHRGHSKSDTDRGDGSWSTRRGKNTRKSQLWGMW